MNRFFFHLRSLLVAALFCTLAATGRAESIEPASEPSVLAVAKAMPAVVNVNTERIVRRAVRDPYDDFITQFFGEQMRPTAGTKSKSAKPRLRVHRRSLRLHCHQ